MIKRINWKKNIRLLNNATLLNKLKVNHILGNQKGNMTFSLLKNIKQSNITSIVKNKNKNMKITFDSLF